MRAKLIKVEDGYELLTQGFLKGSTNHELIDSLNIEEGNIRYKISLKNCQAIERGYDLDELAKDGVKNFTEDHIDRPIARMNFKKGFQKAVELMGDKKFSEEDVRKAIDIARNGSMQEQHNGYGRPTELRFVLDNLSSDEIIQSLQQTEWEVEIVTFTEDDLKSVSEDWGKLGKPKLDTDGCLILKTFKSE